MRVTDTILPTMLRGLLALFLVIICHTANAYNFTLERNEWATWPGYCKARYVTTQVGGRSEFRSEVSGETVEYWRRAIGHEAFLHIHHYCAGMIWLERAAKGTGDYQLAHMLNRAVQETRYTYRNIGPKNPMAAVVASTMAIAYLQSGDDASAEGLVNELIGAQPRASEPYVAGAVVYHRVGRFQKALELLRKGEESIGEPTAEFYYVLGLTLVELEKYSEAKEYAELAYGMGYPLAGLKRRLEEASAR